MRRSIVLLASMALAACTASPGPAEGPSITPPEASEARTKVPLTSYTHGKTEGDLARHLVKVFSPKKWRGETDGPVLMSAATLLTLTDVEKAALRTILRDGHAVLVTRAAQEQLDRLHAVAAPATTPAITVGAQPAAQPAELYVIGYPHARLRTLVLRGTPAGMDRAELEARWSDQAAKVAEWFQEHVRGTYLGTVAAGTDPGNYDVLGTKKEDFPWMHSEQYQMPAYYAGTCTGTKSCTNTVLTNIYAWAVHNPLPLTGQPGDFVIARLTGSIDVANCELPLGSNNRFAGYWLQQANLSAQVEDVTMGGYRLPGGVSIGDYAPIATNPDVQETNGVTWSFGGSGTISGSAGFSGAKPTAEVSKSLGFSFGVSYTNQTSFSYKAVETAPRIPADTVNTTKVLWNYDATHFVHSNLEPNNHACGGPGLQKDVLPPIIYGASFPASQDWVWALQPEVRKALGSDANGYSYLPVQVDTSMLLGWAFYWQDSGYCNQSNATGYHFALGDKNIDIVGLTGVAPLSPLASNADLFAGDGLNFDSGCGTTTNFGTIPLGDRHDGDRRNNVGPPFPFDTMKVNLPLAPDPRKMTLSAIEPASGPPGQTVTLRGTALNTATSVNFGGQAPYSMTLEIPADGVPVITVTAPNRIAPVGSRVMISVQNAVVTSAAFPFVYTR